MGDALAVSSPAGWYDDPQDPSQQRYWDGGFWTDYRRPREAPPQYQGAPQYGGGQPYQGAPPYQGGGPYQAGQPYQGAPAYREQGFGYGPNVPSTPDGVELAGWWKRVWARLLDGLIVLIGGLPLTGYFFYNEALAVFDYERDMFDRAAAGDTQFNTTLPWEAYKWAIPGMLIALVISFAYEYFFLTRTGATLGKKALGISVRLREVAGPPPGLAVAKRFGVYYGLSLLGGVPVIGSLFGLLGLLNDLWPLWDDKKQALHDKVAATNVVLGPQPR